MRALLPLLVALLALACAPGDVPASHAQRSTSGGEASPTRYLRQLSLDLRGAPPSADEYRAVARFGVVPEGLIDSFLRDPRFLTRVKRWHADLLWPSVAGFELTVGARLVVTPGRRQNLSVDNINPERLVVLLDARSDEPVCPPPTSPAHLTAASCCTAAAPDHPACCRVRHAAYDASDPACVAKSAALPAVYSYGVGAGDRSLRGGDTYLGCDETLEYPPPRVGARDARWPHDGDLRPYYTSPRTGARRYYYDERDIPIPYHDATRCPDYCRRATGSGPGGAITRADYVAKTRTRDGVAEEGDGPGFACPAGYVAVTNPCDNVTAVRLSSRVELRQEGWRLTQPWWAGGRYIKTCAYDAQERPVSAHSGQPCRPGLVFEASCGCGERGLACAPYTGDAQNPSLTLARLRDALGDEPLELLATVIDRDEDYATVFTTRRGVANGPLAFMNRHQVEQVGELEFSASAARDAIPDLPWDDAAWHTYERGAEHSGVLTTPAYLARFGTDRARANQFRTAFLCAAFTPSPTPLPSPRDACNREPDLARRCGCRGCHGVLEPMGAHWGRWAERGALFLDPRRFPVDDGLCASCVGNGCPTRCRHYVTAPGDAPPPPFVGRLQAYLYRSPGDVRHIAAGPRALVEASVANGDLQRCAARTVWQRLHNRPMNDREERTLLPALLREFEASGRSYRALVRAVVSSPSYRWID